MSIIHVPGTQDLPGHMLNFADYFASPIRDVTADRRRRPADRRRASGEPRVENGSRNSRRRGRPALPPRVLTTAAATSTVHAGLNLARTVPDNDILRRGEEDADDAPAATIRRPRRRHRRRCRRDHRQQSTLSRHPRRLLRDSRAPPRRLATHADVALGRRRLFRVGEIARGSSDDVPARVKRSRRISASSSRQISASSSRQISSRQISHRARRRSRRRRFDPRVHRRGRRFRRISPRRVSRLGDFVGRVPRRRSSSAPSKSAVDGDLATRNSSAHEFFLVAASAVAAFAARASSGSSRAASSAASSRPQPRLARGDAASRRRRSLFALAS